MDDAEKLETDKYQKIKILSELLDKYAFCNCYIYYSVLVCSSCVQKLCEMFFICMHIICFHQLITHLD